jgi:hypothetical protein
MEGGNFFKLEHYPILSSIQASAPLIHPRLDSDGGIAYLAQTHAAGL